MQQPSRLIVSLLVLVALLLAANLAMNLTGRETPAPAFADIVSGKNYFSTHSPDGRTVFLWYYDYSGAPSESNAYIRYLGQIAVGGTFSKQ